MSTLKHYYDDNGVTTYDINSTLLTDLALALTAEHSRDEQRNIVHNLAVDLEYDYNYYKDFGGIGGCITLDQWLATPSHGIPGTEQLKRILFDFASKDYLIDEFLLVAHDAICKIQINYLLHGK
jgi:hypothetical protein